MKSNKKISNKKGNILAENLIFIVLNILFISIILFFLFSQTGKTAVLEEKYAKQIALAIDAAEPGMIINVEMDDAFSAAEKEGWPLDKVVTIQDNVVRVQLSEKGGYTYSYFNNVEVTPNLDRQNRLYFFAINKK